MPQAPQPSDTHESGPRQKPGGARPALLIIAIIGLGIFAYATMGKKEMDKSATPGKSAVADASAYAGQVDDYAADLLKDGREIFRYDSFGSEAFWGDQLQLHQAIAGSKNGGVGDGLAPTAALKAGLKVDLAKVPATIAAALKVGSIDLDDPNNTLALIKADAVIGVKGIFTNDKLTSIGITCAMCHSTVDDSFAPGIGQRLDGWPNRDLNVGAIVAMAPKLEPLAEYLHTDVATVKNVVGAWGPGKYDAELLLDGKGFLADGKTTSATLLPAAYGLAGVNLHTYTGWGGVAYWNAYVAHTQMHGSGNLYDPRLDNARQFPLAAEYKLGHSSTKPDLITAKLPALHFYQLSLPSPKAPKGTFDDAASIRGEALFNNKAMCATCHVPPLYTEPGHSLHTPAEIGIDSFHADRSPTHMYRTTPLRGLWANTKGGYYHDGRFADLNAVVEHYNGHLNLQLTTAEKNDLVQFLLSI